MVQEKIVDNLLDGLNAADAIGEALRLIGLAKDQLWIEVGESIANQLVSRNLSEHDISGILKELESRATASARFVRARILAYQNETEAALDGFGETLRASAVPDAFVLLHRARLLARIGRYKESIADYGAALRLYPPYSFFVRSEKLLERLVNSGEWQPRRAAKIALLSSSSTTLLAGVLRAVGFREGMLFDIYEPAFGTYRQEILDEGSGLYRFRPEIVLIVPNQRDLPLPPYGGRAHAEKFCADLKNLWASIISLNPCHIVQVGIDSPRAGSWQGLEHLLPEGRQRVFEWLNLSLTESLPPPVSFIDPNMIAAEVGPEYWSDYQWHSAKQYPSSVALPRFADHLSSHCAAVLGLSAKVLTVDLDNTLWGGVIGEDQLGGIRIGPPGAEGEGFRALQQYLKELKERGILLAVCSKNNPEDAKLPFREHEGMLLKIDDFSAFVANWQDKASNLQTISEDLSLGLDSFVFLDDNPMERALVRTQLPQVAVPECGSTPWSMLASLRRGLYFPSVSLTKEDLERHQSYKNVAALKMLTREATSLDGFLTGLEMVALHGSIDDKTLLRVTQLINKTNQFNLTTRRYTEEQVRIMSRSSDWWCQWFHIADRFGDHGLIGVILARRGIPSWTVDTWLMSCRVLGRNIEQFMVSVLLKEALNSGATSVLGEFIPTAKNTLVKDLYPRLGFVASPGKSAAFAFDLKGKSIPECSFVMDKSREAPLDEALIYRS